MKPAPLRLALLTALGLSACPADDDNDDGASDASASADTSASATNPTDPATTDPATTDPATTDPATTDPTATDGPAPSCELVNIVSSPGLEGCFACMTAMCCAELQLCDQTQRCLDCLADPLDLEACVDSETFQSYPEYAGFASCQTALCVPPCGVDGGSSCTPGDCAASCPNYGSGCA